jgi:hypothetical protein
LLEDNNLVGISFGADFCAEHEWGIRDIQKHFQMDEKPLGLESRRLKEFNPEHWMFAVASDGHAAILVFDAKAYNFYDYKHLSRNDTILEKTYGNMKQSFKNSLGIYGEKEIAAAWDGHSFGLHVIGKDNVKKLKRIWQAVQENDVAVWLGGSANPFENNGLILAICSSVSKENKKVMQDADEERINFTKLVEEVEKKTQIKEKLKAMGFEWHALSAKPKGHFETMHPIVYWLNPSRYKQYRQHNMLFGYVTIETLLNFINGQENLIVTDPHKKGY